MIQLVPMNEDQYDAFMELSERDQIEGQVRVGRWRADEAEARMAELKAQFLPLGMATPDHFFWSVKDTGSGEQVGGLWFALVEEAGQRAFFVFDIQVYEPYRRRGCGTQAFRAMEEKAREMEVSTVALHVFEDNLPARAMYHKLGYAGSGSQMTKAVPRSV